MREPKRSRSGPAIPKQSVSTEDKLLEEACHAKAVHALMRLNHPELYRFGFRLRGRVISNFVVGIPPGSDTPACQLQSYAEHPTLYIDALLGPCGNRSFCVP